MHGLGFSLGLLLLISLQGILVDPWLDPELNDFSSRIDWHGLTIDAWRNESRYSWIFRVTQDGKNIWEEELDTLSRTGIRELPLLNDGNKQLVVCVNLGGSAPVTECRIFSSQPKLRLIHATKVEEVLGPMKIADLNEDGILEIGHAVYGFAELEICSACLPRPLAIFRYDDGQGRYLPANPDFPEHPNSRIKWDLNRYEQEKIEEDNTDRTYGAKLQVVFDWLFACRDEEAWEFLARENEVEEISSDEEEFLFEMLNDNPFYRQVRSRCAQQENEK